MDFCTDELNLNQLQTENKECKKFDLIANIVDLEMSRLHNPGQYHMISAQRNSTRTSCRQRRWGVNCDCESVMCQIVPIPLQVEPVRIVDIQLAFSAPRRRQSMMHMLARVPRNLPANMPENEQIDWDDFHSCNSRALEFSNRVAACAMDHVCWIDVILRSQSVPCEYYASACIATEYVLTQMVADPHGVKALKMRFQWINKCSGARRAEWWTSLLLHSSSPRWLTFCNGSWEARRS